MRQNLLYIIVSVCLMIGCNQSQSNQSEATSSVDDEIVAENSDYQVSLLVEALDSSWSGMDPIPQVSIWVYDKNKNEKKKLLLSHPDSGNYWFNSDHAVMVSTDVIPTISSVTILSGEGEPLKLLLEGCGDYRNIFSFILEAGKDSALCLPTNDGLIGISTLDTLLIMQSSTFYEHGGRYNTIQAFDRNGNLISSMEARTREELEL